ncbi:MAG: substrate-binding domain-containing protein [Candidatus Promineifilaceae bacterium]|nr:substrate-binding domain-containing protein [Candidatus Promineifilaceae bacterium]
MTVTATPYPGEMVTDPDEVPDGALEIEFWTNDTKAEWVGEVTARFNQAQHKTANGQPIFVHVFQSDSGDFLPWLLDEEMRPTAWSPGTIAWVNEANVQWEEVHGRPLVTGDCSEVVYTAIGIGMWRPMAEAMGWPDTPIGWDDIVELAADPEGWARYGHPEWGQFKFGHTHPGGSNTGLLALTSLVYNTLDISEGLTPQLVHSEPVVAAFEKLEGNTYHYGLSTRSLFTAMARRGPSYLHAGTNSEIGVLATNHYQAEELRFPLVFIAPAEGTFWSENPFCLIDGEWVTEAERAAAELYREYLLDKEAQEIAVDEWLRPVREDVPLRAPLDLAHGIDPRITPETVQPLASVGGETVQAVQDLFAETKKPAQVYVLLDTSGSMDGTKIRAARDGTVQFIQGLHRNDGIAIYTFADRVETVQALAPVGSVGESLIREVQSIDSSGDTALYDAVCTLVTEVTDQQRRDQRVGESRLYGIVLLSDGENTAGILSETEMMACLPPAEDAGSIKIFTIAYGNNADEALLERIAEATNGRAYTSDPEHVEEVYEAIAFEQ